MCIRDSYQPFSADRIGRVLGQIEELEQQAQAAWDSAAGVYDELQAAINALPSPNLRTVLCARYLDLLTWERVASVLFGSRDDVYKRQVLTAVLCPVFVNLIR